MTPEPRAHGPRFRVLHPSLSGQYTRTEPVSCNAFSVGHGLLDKLVGQVVPLNTGRNCAGTKWLGGTADLLVVLCMTRRTLGAGEVPPRCTGDCKVYITDGGEVCKWILLPAKTDTLDKAQSLSYSRSPAWRKAGMQLATVVVGCDACAVASCAY